jgi:signal transduction histidine kinase
MDSDKEKALNKAHQKVIAISFNQAPIDDIESYVIPEVMAFGTAIDEHIYNLKDYKSLVKRQEKQTESEGLKFHYKSETVVKRISPDQDSALLVDLVKACLKSNDDVVHQFNLRITMVLEYISGQWKLVHLHGSLPVDSENDPWHIEEFRREKERLERKVAEQTADLQIKNRELEIEAASERVRTNAMGMQEPDDIMNVLNVIKNEVEKFELGNVGTWIWIFNDDQTLTQWDISEINLDGNLANVNITMDLRESNSSKRHAPKWKSADYYTMPWKGEDLHGLINEVTEQDEESGRLFQEAVDEGRMTTYWQACAPFSKGVVGLDYVIEPPEDAKHILKKMAAAFDMAYQRFEDLQEAERRARESKIETSLERVRSRSMAMHQSDELQEVIQVLYQEMSSLGVDSDAAYIVTHLGDKLQEMYISTPDNTYASLISIPKTDHVVVENTYSAWARGPHHFVFSYTQDEKNSYFRWLFENSDFRHIPQERKETILSGSGWVLSTVVLKNCLFIVQRYRNEQFTSEETELHKRFANVFEQAYTRFLDLEKAEKQSYESRVEASLERIRGMAATMNHSDDLMQIAEAMFREMEFLQINPLRYGLGMIDEEKKEAELWASTVDHGKYLDILGTLSLTWHPMLVKAFDAWSAQYEELIYELKGKELSNYYKRIGQVNPDIPDLDKLQDPESGISQFVSFFPFKTGTLYAFTTDEPGEEGKSILKRFANAFEQAHIRYEDLQVAEKQSRLIREERDRLEIALRELKAAKDQLVQQEKLASLGQLTAGIAHEIKNPLNFVNNFSDVSIELVEEAMEEVKSQKGKVKSETGDGRRETGVSPFPEGIPTGEGGKGGEAGQGDETEPGSRSNPDMELILEILGDIEANLRKIHEHGSRADSIVKSMLQHSRGGSGSMEPTDLNALVKEYVNLAFHGMRAAKDPINVDIDLQLDNSIGEVPLIAEDFSRVLLNLCNNAFDAMREKLNTNAKDKSSSQEERGNGSASEYNPKLTVRSLKSDSVVKIEIEDNGTGIPDEMKDKIMQPFFTTKKGTEGTGLGLSITNDIIKAHGGNLELATKQNEFTRLTIILNNK